MLARPVSEDSRRLHCIYYEKAIGWALIYFDTLRYLDNSQISESRSFESCTMRSCPQTSSNVLVSEIILNNKFIQIQDSDDCRHSWRGSLPWISKAAISLSAGLHFHLLLSTFLFSLLPPPSSLLLFMSSIKYYKLRNFEFNQ